MNKKLDLSGEWLFRLDEQKTGIDAHFEKETEKYDDTIMLPGTTSLAQKGNPNRNRETYFLTEVYKYVGYAWYSRKVELPIKSKADIEKKHFYLTLERTRISYVWVDGEFAGVQDSFIAKHVYDLTGYIKSANPVITIMVSNTDYAANGGHMTSDDTQTNWNGIIGEISLEICDKARISHVTTFCDYKKKQAIIKTEIEGFANGKQEISISADLCRLKKQFLEYDSDCSVWEERATKMQAAMTDMSILEEYLDITENAAEAIVVKESLEEGSNELEFVLQLPKNAKEWDEEEPWVYRIKVSCAGSEKYTWFGLREFKSGKDHFEINGRKTFLRGRHQGMLFPLSGFAPMNVTGWLKDFKIARDWGINHERCHTCTPPEAAFIAADLLGFYFQPEIPFWGTWQADTDENFKDVEVAQDFLTVEGFNILEEYAGHPSFVMMSMGNELWGSAEALNELLGGYKQVRPDIMFTQGSNNFQWIPNIQPNDDFFSGVRFTIDRQIRGSYAQCDAPLGRIQTKAPSTNWNYDEAIHPSYLEKAKSVSEDGTIEIQYGTGVKRVKLSEAQGELIPEIPVVSHEIGQYFVYPDFDEIRHYTGVCQARNLEVFQERLDDVSLYKRAKGYFKASGSLAMACYKEELEAALRSKLMAGFQILDLQDYTGQGTALVGPLNGLMENKGLLTAAEWRKFCARATLLGEFDSYVLDNGGKLKLAVKLAYYGKKKLKGVKLMVTFTGAEGIVFEDTVPINNISECGVSELGSFAIEVPKKKEPARYSLSLRLAADKAVISENGYDFWSYPKVSKAARDEAAEDVVNRNAEKINAKCKKVNILSNIRDAMDSIDEGKPILFYLSNEDNQKSIPGAYCTDFWNYPMFRSISESMGKTWPVGTLGTLIADKHPALAGFPTEIYSTPQWFEIIERSNVSILNGIGFRPVVTVIDNCERNNNLGIIYEFEIMDGKNGPCHVLVCTSPLRKLIAEGNAPAAALEKSLIAYLESGVYECEVRTNTGALRRLSV